MKRAIILLGLSVVLLVACNGNGTSTTTNNPSQGTQLQQYINLLTYIPEDGKQFTGSPTSQQQSFSTPGDTTINSVVINYYSGSYCSGTLVATTTLQGPATPAAGSYSSTNASNVSLCGKYARNGSTGCAGLYDDVSAVTPQVSSMQFTYNLESDVITSQCLYNPNNNPYSHGAFDAVLNYSQTPPVACTLGGSCGFSESYPTNSLFTQVNLPQTGQLYCVPGTTFSSTCISPAIASPAGSDGYGRTTLNGDNIPFGVPWAYNGTGALNPTARFSTGTQGNGTSCPSGEEVRNDNLTGLMWLESPTSATYKWQDTLVTPNTYPALAVVAEMNASSYCGYTDWRLPNVNELTSMVNQGAGSGSQSVAAWLNSQGFSNVLANYYWSSTTYANNTVMTWLVNMNDGSVGYGYKDSNSDHYVWPVRGTTALSAQISQTGQTTAYAVGDDGFLQKGTVGTSASRRFIVGNEAESTCIIDQQTGLMWVKDVGAVNSGGSSWSDAISIASDGNWCGHSDWRLPNRNELRSLVNYGQSSLATWLNSQGFIGVQDSYYWSSTTYALNTDDAWFIGISDSSVGNVNKTYAFYIWPVRGGQPAPTPGWSQVGESVQSSSYFTSIIQDGAGNIYAGGYTPNMTGGVWEWNGSAWSQLGGNVTSSVSFGSIIRNRQSGYIYAGGRTVNDNGGLWEWNGSNWSQLGGDVTSAYQLSSIIQDEAGNIYAGTQASNSQPQSAGVWKWDGTSWSELGGENVESALVFTSIIRDDLNNIYAAGSTVTGGGGVWKWNGVSWSQLGTSISAVNLFRSIIRDASGNIYAAGTSSGIFNTRGCVWKWNGTSWSQLGTNVSTVSSFGSIVQDLAGNIYAGGQTAGTSSGALWMWNGSSWSQLGSNVTSASAFVSILQGEAGNIYAGGATAGTAYGGVWSYQP